MGSKVLQAKFDQNLAKMFKKQPLYKKGSVRPHRGTKPIFLYKKSFCTGLKATHFVEGIGRGIHGEIFRGLPNPTQERRFPSHHGIIFRHRQLSLLRDPGR